MTSTLQSPCFFGFDHLGSQCCTVDPDSVQTHVEDECSFLGKCCISQLESFPDASKMRKSKKEEYVSLKEVLDGILASKKLGKQSALFPKKIAEDNVSFLQKKGYVVKITASAICGEGVKSSEISWEAPFIKENPPVKESPVSSKAPKEFMERLDNIIDQIDEILPSSSGRGMIGFQLALSEENQKFVSQAFPGYSFDFRRGDCLSYSRMTWPVTESAVAFFEGVKEAISASPDQGSKKYGMAAMIFQVWMDSLADRYKTLDFKIVEKNTGRKTSQVLQWHAKSAPKKTKDERIVEIFTKFGIDLPLSLEITRQAKITEEELVELEKGALDVKSFIQTLANIKIRRTLQQKNLEG